MAPPRANPTGNSGRGALAAFSRFWHASFVVLLTAYLLVQFLVEPFHRMFSISDLRISFPYAEVERVPTSHSFIYSLFLPLAVVLVTNLLTRAPAHKHHVAVLGLAISLVLTSLLTDVLKNAAGRPRPDLLARCAPAPGTPRDALVSLAACTTTGTKDSRRRLHDGWRSFPSGHSSFAFAGLGYLSLFLAGQLRVFARVGGYDYDHDHDHDDGNDGLAGGEGPGISRRGSMAQQHAEHVVRGDLLRALVCLAPLLGATMIAVSRCQDYRHDVYDVSVGAVLGWTVTYWSYRRYWPRLSSGRCDTPYAGPPAAEVAGRYGRLRDEEEGLVRAAAGRRSGGVVQAELDELPR
ncbi:cee4baa8-96da-4e9c-b9d1-14fc891ba9d5 [Thermothielavioides terrestris]|uniref:Cee4baa8-96da-4e9c-b9d1-14fc891ba9d5 n=1 Tax=Thermothielavioides terrestris TaxID=2587410 RepID=A0A446BLK7_9PEZI|nr:cee4baa8-96da-4e9c-b9d1-14fc891ba9d5 [Thermothielavioides terrestris]